MINTNYIFAKKYGFNDLTGKRQLIRKSCALNADQTSERKKIFNFLMKFNSKFNPQNFMFT